MFLTKTNAKYFSKPKKPISQKRILPGWGDDDEQQPTTNFRPQIHGDLFDEGKLTLNDAENQVPIQKEVKKTYFDWDELNEMNNIDFEKKLVEGIVEPGGIRIKPNDNLLNDFLKEAKGMETAIVGSLLLSKVEVNYPFQIKAKSLYTIEFLVKKSSAYLNYFKTESDKLKEFPEPEDNAENYRKILKNVLNTIGVSVESTGMEDSSMNFVDPGYNDTKEESQIHGFMKNKETNKPKKTEKSKKFISPNEAKKFQGPNTKKTEETFDLLSGEQKPQQSNTNPMDFDELLLGTSQPAVSQSNPITFDDLLKGPSSQKPKGQGGYDFTL